MRMIRSLFIGGLALLASAALSVALLVTPITAAPVPIALAVGRAGIALFVISAPSLRFKGVMRFDELRKHLRLFRFMWERGTPEVLGGGYSAKLAIGLRPLCPASMAVDRA